MVIQFVIWLLLSFPAFALKLRHADAVAALKCCALRGSSIETTDHAALMECANRTATHFFGGVDDLWTISSKEKHKVSPAKRFAIISYANNQISDYASYAALLNAIWARSHGYLFALADSRHAAYEFRDARWNKVKIVERALSSALSSKQIRIELDHHTTSNPGTESATYHDGIAGESEAWGHGADYVLWLDSDLVVLDFALDLEAVLKTSHSKPDKNGAETRFGAAATSLVTNDMPLSSDCESNAGESACHADTTADVEFDIIACRDPRPENGLINTGALLVKASNASLHFFRRWWSMDRAAGMDQHAFDRLWEAQKCEAHQITANASEKRNDTLCFTDEIEDSNFLRNAASSSASSSQPARVRMLPPHVLNSHFPAWLHQQPEHAVLHLAGVSSLARRTLFSQALDEVCRAAERTVHTDEEATPIDGHAETSSSPCTGSSHLCPQLGLDRDTIKAVVLNTTAALMSMTALIVDVRHLEARVRDPGGPLPPLDELSALHARGRDSRQAGYSAHTFVKLDVDSADEARTSLALATQLDSLRALYSLQSTVWQRVSWALADAAKKPIHSPFSENPTNVDAFYAAETLQSLLDAGFNLAVELTAPDERLDLLRSLQPFLIQLQDTVQRTASPSAQMAVTYFAFKFECFYAEALADTASHEPAAVQASAESEAQALDRAWELWIIMQRGAWAGAGNQLADPSKEVVGVRARYGAIQCEVLGRCAVGIKAFHEAEGLLRKWGDKLARAEEFLQSRALKQPEASLDTNGVGFASSLDTGVMTSGSADARHLETHVPPYAMGSMMGVYLSHASCALKAAQQAPATSQERHETHERTQTQQPRDGRQFWLDTSLHFINRARLVLRHVRCLLEQKVWGYEPMELSELRHEYAPALHAVEQAFQRANRLYAGLVDANGGEEIRHRLTRSPATAAPKWKRRKSQGQQMED